MNSQDFESYVPVYDSVPERWEDAREFLVEHLKKISNAVNIREIGWFLDEELLSGKQFIPSATATSGRSQQARSVLRKVIDFGALPNGTIPGSGKKSVPHGITFDNNFTLIQLFASATTPSANAIPIPYAQVSFPAVGNVELNMDTTNVNITTTANLTAYTRCFVVIEYIQEL